MDRTRDWRRAQKNRIIKRVVKSKRLSSYSDYDLPDIYNLVSWYDVKGNKRHFHSWRDIHEQRWMVAKCTADNRALCSGPCCGNPRKWFDELTIQEKRHAITCKEAIKQGE